MEHPEGSEQSPNPSTASQAPPSQTLPRVSQQDAAFSAPQSKPARRSPFRQVLEASDGTSFEHRGRRFFATDSVAFDLKSGETVMSCDDSRGYFLSGKNLYFAARMSPYSMCPDAPFLLEYVEKQWKLRRFIDAHNLLLDEWISGTTIAAVVPYRAGSPLGYELVKVSGTVSPPRPRKGATDPTDPERKCYSELQQPLSLHAFPSGTIMVVGEARCDLPTRADEELTDEEERERYRPAIEIFEKGRTPSKIFSLPFDEMISLIETDSENLLMMGKISGGDDESAQAGRVLVSFDGKTVQKLNADAGNAERLVLGTAAAAAHEAGQAPTNPPREVLDRVWLLDAEALRPLLGEREPLFLPPKCDPSEAWFDDGAAWLVCDSGLYTTDEEQGPISLPTDVDKSTCEVLDPRPEYAVPGIYKKASSPGGCSARGRRSSGKGGGPSKLHSFDVQGGDPWDDFAPRSVRPEPSKPSPHRKLEF